MCRGSGDARDKANIREEPGATCGRACHQVGINFFDTERHRTDRLCGIDHQRHISAWFSTICASSARKASWQIFRGHLWLDGQSLRRICLHVQWHGLAMPQRHDQRTFLCVPSYCPCIIRLPSRDSCAIVAGKMSRQVMAFGASSVSTNFASSTSKMLKLFYMLHDTS